MTLKIRSLRTMNAPVLTDAVAYERDKAVDVGRHRLTVVSEVNRGGLDCNTFRSNLCDSNDLKHLVSFVMESRGFR